MRICRNILCALILSIGFMAPAYATTVSYTYDGLGRVKQASYSSGVVIQYTYDAAGNRTQSIITGAAADPPTAGVIVLPIAGFIVIPIN